MINRGSIPQQVKHPKKRKGKSRTRNGVPCNPGTPKHRSRI